MELNLWILVDNQGRIYYTSSHKSDVEAYYKLMDQKDLIIKELKEGE